MLIQLAWNAIIKALWGAENSMNKTFQGKQPTLSVPPHYFTYLQPKQANLPPPPPHCGGGQEHLEHSPSAVFVCQRREWMGGLVLAEVTEEKMTRDSNPKLVSICSYSKLIISNVTQLSYWTLSAQSGG